MQLLSNGRGIMVSSTALVLDRTMEWMMPQILTCLSDSLKQDSFQLSQPYVFLLSQVSQHIMDVTLHLYMFSTSCLWQLCDYGAVLTLQIVTLTQQFSLSACIHIEHLCTLTLTVLIQLCICIDWLMFYLSELMYLEMLTIHGTTDPLPGMQELPIDQITYLVCEPIHCVTCESIFQTSLTYSELLLFVLSMTRACKLWPLDGLGPGLSGNLGRFRRVKFLTSLSWNAWALLVLQTQSLTQIAVQMEHIACNLVLPLYSLIQCNCSLWHTHTVCDHVLRLFGNVNDSLV